VFRPVDLSIVLSQYNIADAAKLLSRQVRVVNNGIPDPCPDFAASILPRRRASFAARQKLFAGDSMAEPLTLRVLFLAHCTQEKGLFAAIESIQLANRQLAARGLPAKLELIAAGNFVTGEERAEFDRLRQDPVVAASVQHAGFVAGDRKHALYAEADLFLFPTRYLGENQPVNLIEAMAFGLPIVTTRWRSLPEMLPPHYPGLVSGQNVGELAAAILLVLAEKSGEQVRQHFIQKFTLEQHLTSLAAALHDV